MATHEVSGAAGAGLPRRLLGHASGALWLVGAVVLGWFLWPSSLGGCTTVTIVSGESMEPTYYTGDLVVSRCGEVEVGDVIVYQPADTGGARIIHRVIGGSADDGWLVQGDNNDFVDPWEPRAEEILGSPVLHLPQVGRFASILLSPLTWISLLVVALAVVIWPSDEPDADDADDVAQGAATPAAEPVDADDDAPGPLLDPLDPLDADDPHEPHDADDDALPVGTPATGPTTRGVTA